jgi:hypothetical protein
MLYFLRQVGANAPTIIVRVGYSDRFLQGMNCYARIQPQNIPSLQTNRVLKQMAFKKGISGNPGGRSGEKIFTDALRLELNRIDPNDKEKRKKVNRLAEKLVECAIEDKQAWAFQQIADRLEGKPVQVVDATVDDNRTIDQFSDAELSAILRRRVGVVPVESDERRPEGEALN